MIESGGPSAKCFNSAWARNSGRTQSKEHVEKRKQSLLLRYNRDSYLGCNDHKEFMQKNNFWADLGGKTISGIIKEYKVPYSSVYKWIKRESISDENKIINFCKEYHKYSSSLELIMSKGLNIDIYNKKCHSGLRYRPDFKLSDNIYLNTDGLYWHSEAIKSDKHYHFNMRKEYEALNLRIFQFRANEVTNNLNIISSMVSNAQGNTKNKVGARKCKILKVKTAEALKFLNENHIKGFMNSNHIGLYYKKELVSLMSYKLNKNKAGRLIKIDRFCSKAGWNVMGGFSRLLKDIQSNYPKFPVHYWVDLRYGTGTFLLNHGFDLEKETLGWQWTNFSETYNRLKCKANMDSRALSEKKHAKELGWCKIYDAGQRLYVKHP